MPPPPVTVFSGSDGITAGVWWRECCTHALNTMRSTAAAQQHKRRAAVNSLRMRSTPTAVSSDNNSVRCAAALVYSGADLGPRSIPQSGTEHSTMR